MRIDGHFDFAGSVRIHGTVCGDVTGTGDPEAKAVVAESGTVVGTIRAANIVVQGRVDGPMVSDRTIEVFPSGRCTGGAQYNALSVQEGGVIDGMLQLASSIDVARPRKSARGAIARPRQDTAGGATLVSEDVTTAPSDTPATLPALRPAGTIAPTRRPRVALWVASTVVVILVAVWALRGPKKPEPEPLRIVAPLPAEQPATSPPAQPSTLPLPSQAVASGPATATPASKPPTPPSMAATAPPKSQVASPRADDSAGRIVSIEGANADKPAGAFFVLTREATVILRKKRSDPGDGMRLEIARGRNISLQVARDEIVRVASGRDIEVFYQGRRVPPASIEAGSWLSFVPASRPATPAAPPQTAPAAVPAAESAAPPR
jgi:cytoskeletal protein CcmA (bactofilin family)